MITLNVTRKDLLKWRQDTDIEDIDIHDFMRRAKEIKKVNRVIFIDKGQTKVLKDEPFIENTLIERLYEQLQGADGGN